MQRPAPVHRARHALHHPGLPQRRCAASSAALPALAEATPAPEPRTVEANVGMIGCGNMGGAIVKGWIQAGVLAPENLAASCRSEASARQWQDLGMEVFGDSLEDAEAKAIADFCDVICLGVKPKYLGAVLAALAPHVTRKHTIVSIAAGWPIAALEAALPAGTAVVRVMPNTPIMVGQGASVYCLGAAASDADREVVATLLGACGLALRVEEDAIDAVIGVAGSAPAYMFQVLEAMADGGVSAGLPRNQALMLAAQTMKGAAEMVLNSNGDGELTHPGVLKDQVTSPGGTTIAAVAALEAQGVRHAFITAVETAAAKSAAMSATTR